MSQLPATPAGDAREGLHTDLHAELRALIASSRQRLAGAVNAELTRLYWTLGQRLSTEVLGGERASYGAQLLDQLGQQLSQEFGRGFEARNLRRMVRFAQAFPDAEIVSTLSTKLSWSHLVAIVPLKTPEARQFFAGAAGGQVTVVGERMDEVRAVQCLDFLRAQVLRIDRCVHGRCLGRWVRRGGEGARAPRAKSPS